MKISSFSLSFLSYCFFFFSLSLYPSVTLCDKFDHADYNHDGLLDRQEYSALMTEFKESIDPFLLSSSDSLSNKPLLTDKSPLIDMISEFFHGTMAEDFISGCLNSLVVIWVTEIGDKTFFIAAVLAMRNGRTIVYLGCMAALAAMHVLSCLMGYALPALLPKVYTHYASALLFVYFGIRLLKDAHEMGDGPSEELQEVEEELIDKKDNRITENDDEEIASSTSLTPRPTATATAYSSSSTSMKTDHLKIFSQAFTLTFLAEWGDRSQIATIALASSKNVFGVIVGGLVGHAMCTGLAVLGGRMLAAKISERTVALVGGILFLVFALHSFIVGP